ncbi:hypothetical protein BBK82_07190 [Lentzea guizhouensis]|uniref:Uncharacterized protein n=1 Tax=Lentzea guizhouensis TaxID=1586287 RepID=A0A1B2HDV1_9PSEU|nr:hypothetical protein [Lentzea guizhouensis]ANZ35901.1 hypothetical protein BBK82_07190 [Lentzea guizhouensis]
MNDWAHDLVRRMCDQVDETEAAAGERCPLYLHNGHWRTSARGSWTGGFWAGLLTLRALATGTGDVAPARDRLDVWADADTVLRGMIFWYGSGAERLGLIAPRSSTAKVADSLASGFDPELGAIPWGTALAADGPPVRADGAAGAVPLLDAHGHRDIARHHRDAHSRLDPDWPRGKAWLLLTDPRTDRNVSTEDSSALAIAAVALLKAGRREEGERLLRTLPEGAEYDGMTGLKVVWGDFFTFLGAAIVTGLVLPDAW